MEPSFCIQNAVLIEGREKEGARELPWDRTLEAGKSREGVSTPLIPLTTDLLPRGVPSAEIPWSHLTQRREGSETP